MTAGVGQPHQPAGRPETDPPRAGVDIDAWITPDRLDAGAVHDATIDPEAGAVAVFSGIVRNHHDGQAVTGIDYEAWVPRARTELAAVAADVAADHTGVRRIRVVHRIGWLDVGEISVLCAASAPHREEAFAAARDLIDLVKQRVPVWKREERTDGTIHWPGAEPPSLDEGASH